MSKQDKDFSIDKNLEQDSFEKLHQPEQNYIEDMIEYQDNQFNPGYYVGTGKISPAIKASGNAMPLAIWMFIQAAGLIIFYCFLIKFLFLSNTPYSVVTFTDGSPLFNFIVITVAFLVITLICMKLEPLMLLWTKWKFSLLDLHIQKQKEPEESHITLSICLSYMHIATLMEFDLHGKLNGNAIET
jgi:hypothetical protein